MPTRNKPLDTVILGYQLERGVPSQLSMASLARPASGSSIQSAIGLNRRKYSLSQLAYDATRMAVLRGEMAPGRLFSEAELAGRLGISRTPIREALQRLEKEGLLEIEPQRGFRLRVIPRTERREFFALREMLEIFVVETIANQSADELLEPLTDVVNRQQQAIRNDIEFMNLDEQFHVGLATAAELPRTASLISSLRGLLWLLGTKALQSPDRRSAVIAEHRKVLQALKRGSRVDAVEAMRRHIRNTSAALDETETPTSVPKLQRLAKRTGRGSRIQVP